MSNPHEPMAISAILVAGGTGTRMQASMPKQYLPLQGKPIALYSFELLCSFPEVKEIIVVCDPAYHEIFKNSFENLPRPPKRLTFALPGARRQDSVYNGLQVADSSFPFVTIHDSARPFLKHETVKAAFKAANEYGASVVGVSLKYTIKECDEESMVLKTPDRTRFYEIQTPQTMRKTWLEEGFKIALMQNLTVTDDTSLVELLGYPVKMVEGSYTNIKITTPEDLLLAEKLIAYGNQAS